MKSEYIMSEAEKQERNMKIYERKLSIGRHLDNNHNHNHHNHHTHNNHPNQHHNHQSQQQQEHYQSDQTTPLMVINNNSNNSNDNNNGLIDIESSRRSSPITYNEFVYDEKMMMNGNFLTTILTPSPTTATPANNNDNLIVLDSNSSGNSIDSIDSNNSQDIIYHHHHHHHDVAVDHVDNSLNRMIPTDVIEINDDDDDYESETIDKEEIDRQNMADERLIKLMNKVKIIRECGYSVTKFHLLLRATSSNHPKNVLTEHGSCRLKYLTSIVQILSAETVSDLPTDQKFIDLIRIAEIVTFNFIKMCKKLISFQELSQEDQVSLVKGGVMDTLIIWSMMTINLEKECWEALVCYYDDCFYTFQFSNSNKSQ